MRLRLDDSFNCDFTAHHMFHMLFYETLANTGRNPVLFSRLPFSFSFHVTPHLQNY